jgi:hypothetical protein
VLNPKDSKPLLDCLRNSENHVACQPKKSLQADILPQLVMRQVGLLQGNGGLMAITPIPKLAETMNVKIHDLTRLEEGFDYVLEPSSDLKEHGKFYLTGQGMNIKKNEYVALRSQAKTKHYQVAQVEYYSEPSDMCMACLVELNA